MLLRVGYMTFVAGPLLLLCGCSREATTSGAPAQERAMNLASWADSLESDAYEQCSFGVISETDDERGTVVARAEKELVQRGEWLRTFTQLQNAAGETEIFVEECLIDYNLHVQGRSSPSEPSHIKASARIESWDRSAMRAMALGEMGILFGVLYMPDDESQRIPRLLAAAEQRNGVRRVKLADGGELLAEFTSGSELPTSISHTFHPWMLSDGHLIPNERDKSKRYVYMYRNLQWSSEHGSPTISAFEFASGDANDVDTAPRFRRYKVVKTKLGAELADEAFLPRSNVPERLSVHVDLPAKHEWRDGRVQPLLPAGLNEPGMFAFFSTPRSWVGLIAVSALLMTGAYAGYRGLRRV